MANKTMTSGFVFANKNVSSNRISGIDLNKLKHKSMSTNTTPIFQKKKQYNYSTIIQNLKLDIHTLNDGINENTDILIFYKNPKIVNLNKKFIEKIEEIEISQKFDTDFFFLEEINVNHLLEEYSCQNINDLLIKIHSINQINETFFKKLLDYTFLMNLKYNNDGWKFEENFQETYSRFLWLKQLIDNFIEKKKFLEEKLKFDNKSLQYEIEKFNLEIKAYDCNIISRNKSFSDLNNSTFNFAESNIEGLNEFIMKNCDEKVQEIFKRRSSKELALIPYSRHGSQIWSNKELPKVFYRRDTDFSIQEEKKQEINYESVIKLKDEEIKSLKKILEECI